MTVLHRTVPRGWAFSLLLVAFAAACAAPATGPSPGPVRAAAGDTVSLIQYHVRPEGRARFEQFVRESYWPAVQQLAQADSERARGFSRARFIFPVRASPDGTWTYVFMLDPLVSGASYSIVELLQQAYPADAQQRYQAWTETWARPFTPQVYVQWGPADDAAAADSTTADAQPGATTP